jgi:hypothetical protein
MVEMVHDRIASPKTEKLSLEEAMDLSRDRLILELEYIYRTYKPRGLYNAVIHCNNVCESSYIPDVMALRGRTVMYLREIME